MSRAPIAVALALLLAACGGREARDPFVDSRTPPGLAARFMPPEGWAWGLVQTGREPPQRYGVASPPVAPRGQVLIVTGLGESAEGWFETVSDLNARGLTVWVLERAGQGGSGRKVARGGVIHAGSFEPDVDAVRAMLSVVIHRQPPAPIVVLAHADAAVPALLALERHADADGLVLAAPKLAPSKPLGAFPTLAVRLGLGWPAPDARRWTRAAPDEAGGSRDAWRGRVQHTWEIANPDLRMTGPSWGWRAAYARAGEQARTGAARVEAPVLILGPRAPARLCRAIPSCTEQDLGGGASPYLQPDAVRGPWLEAIARFVATRSGATP
ncbi:MAG: alpha/beta hydrolase [Phenylobacterium sp.]|uniref:serine aminopeptidase domain-containing protein n=1 Tax=Phenylobacterium sp. TaxID=1871053 RepID=UPI0027348CB4|nr:alpha/beta hydrolase [Phenylobacterium sp.]MDP3174604.1 alpha/beta hydrolase [Phenylobacterium sp.]